MLPKDIFASKPTFFLGQSYPSPNALHVTALNGMKEAGVADTDKDRQGSNLATTWNRGSKIFLVRHLRYFTLSLHVAMKTGLSRLATLYYYDNILNLYTCGNTDVLQT